jgi:hypothetical protein
MPGVLRRTDNPLNRLWAFPLEIAITANTAQKCNLVAGIVNAEGIGETDCRDVPSQHPSAETVECRYQRDLESFTNKIGNADLHLLGSLVGKGYRHNVVWIYSQLAHQMGYAASDHSCLTAACASQNQQRPLLVQDRLALLLIEINQ